jgi:dimethylsulfoniopropionate demethylase
MFGKFLSMSRRIRRTPFTRRVEAAGVTSYTAYNHMLLPTVFESVEADYWHLCEHVQVWDVSCERQVEISGPDSQRLVQLMTPRDIGRAKPLQCFYVPLCDVDGGIVNDPIAINLYGDRWWLSIADSDVGLWAQGLATGYGLDVSIREAQVWPLAVQGPKAETLMSRVFGDTVHDIRFFRGAMLDFSGQSMLVTRSGWSKQGGFEIYLNDAELAEPLWDALFEQSADLNARAGCPNLIERIESSLLSYGNDMTCHTNPFECGLDAFIDLDADIESLSLPALRALQGKHEWLLSGIALDQKGEIDQTTITLNNQIVAEITSQVFSPRYQKQLLLAMIDRDYLTQNQTIMIDGVQGKISPLPFTTEFLSS